MTVEDKICYSLLYYNEEYSKNVGFKYQIKITDFLIERFTTFIEYFFQNIQDVSLKVLQSFFEFSVKFSFKQKKKWDKKMIPFINIISKKRVDEFKEEIEKNKRSTIKLSKIEEHIKRQYYDSKIGFHNCQANTTLFNPASVFCLNCSFREDCKQILFSRFKRIYDARNCDEV